MPFIRQYAKLSATGKFTPHSGRSVTPRCFSDAGHQLICANSTGWGAPFTGPGIRAATTNVCVLIERNGTDSAVKMAT
jgi:hypothetical protein